MVNYNEGKIYRIVPNCEHEPHEQYIGSTTKKYLSQRMAQHKIEYNCYKNGTRKYMTRSVQLFDKYGVDNCSIELIECINAKSIDELRQKEKEHIKSNSCVNNNIPRRTPIEWIHDNYEHARARRLKYDEEHKDQIRKKVKEYYTNSQSKYLDYAKQYREENKDELRERRINTYLENKEEYLSKQNLKRKNQPTITCECGGEYKQYNKARHINNKSHTSFICQLSL